MVDFARSRFQPGALLRRPTALQLIAAAGQSALQFINRHVSGDWGVLSPEDRSHNDLALQDGSRIMSAYVIAGGQRVWIITDAADDHGQRGDDHLAARGVLIGETSASHAARLSSTHATCPAANNAPRSLET